MRGRTEGTGPGPAAVAPSTRLAAAVGEPLVAALLATVVACALAWLGPPPGDEPAHLYRVLLAREGVFLWDNLWYAGHYPFSSYSLLYYLPAALVGNLPVVVASVAASAALFASLATRAWGAAARWPSRAFALAACAPLFTGTYSYAAALAALLLTLWAIGRGQTWLAVVGAFLTVGLSPLAFVFLVLALAAIALVRRRVDRTTVIVGAGLVAAAALQLLVVWLFPDDVEYPFRLLELGVVVLVAGLGASLAFRTERGRPIGAFLALWAGACLLLYLAPSPVGENITRLRGVVFPLVLLAAVLVRFRPRALAAAALATSLAYGLVPYVASGLHVDRDPSREAFWAPALDVVRSGAPTDFRVEVVPTAGHWEGYWVPASGLGLARGWYRQIDIKENPLFYEEAIGPGEYRAWLRANGVRYVVVPATELDRGSAAAEEARVLGPAGLRKVFEHENASVWELPEATPILSGPGRAALSRLVHDRIRGRVDAPGTYRLAVRYTPYWRATAGFCPARGPDGMTLLRAEHGGSFELRIADDLGLLARRILERGEPGCP